MRKNQKKQDKKELMNNLEPSKTLEEIKCDKCESKLPTVQNLRMQMRINHMSHCQTQTADVDYDVKITQTCEAILKEQDFLKEYDQYLCFYCEQEITSEQHMLEHSITCHGANDTPSLFSLPVRPKPILFKCAICGLVKSSEAEIVNHKKSIHANQ